MLADAIRDEPDSRSSARAADPFIARDMILQHEPGRRDARHRDAAHGRTDVPAQADGAPSAAGDHRQLADARADRPPASRPCARAPSTSFPSRAARTRSAQVAERSKQRIRAIAHRAVPVSSRRRHGPATCRAHVCHRRPELDGLLVIGASTGGTQATEALLTRLPGRLPADSHRPAHAGRTSREPTPTPEYRVPDACRRGPGRRPAESRRRRSLRRATFTWWSSVQASQMRVSVRQARRCTTSGRQWTCCFTRWRACAACRSWRVC